MYLPHLPPSAPSVPVDDVSEALRMYDIEAAKA
jgi:hypothetical protein